MGLKLVKRVIIRGMMHIFTQTHGKNFTQNTPRTFKGKCSVSGQVK